MDKIALAEMRKTGDPTKDARQSGTISGGQRQTLAIARAICFGGKLVADRFTFLSLGEVIGYGPKADFAGEEIRHLMAGGAAMADLETEIAIRGGFTTMETWVDAI